jgi:hypothetical protein
MSNETKVYLVGPKGSVKKNSFQYMTNNWSEAERLKKELGPTAEHKVVLVKDRGAHS